jgi:hypothetical protein
MTHPAADSADDADTALDESPVVEKATPADVAPAAAPEALTTDVVAGPGGVMTDEVGVVTGDLTLRTETGADGKVVVRVQYKEAEEWYTVTGGRVTVRDPADAAAVHQLAVALLNRPEG